MTSVTPATEPSAITTGMPISGKIATNSHAVPIDEAADGQRRHRSASANMPVATAAWLCVTPLPCSTSGNQLCKKNSAIELKMYVSPQERRHPLPAVLEEHRQREPRLALFIADHERRFGVIVVSGASRPASRTSSARLAPVTARNRIDSGSTKISATATSSGRCRRRKTRFASRTRG